MVKNVHVAEVVIRHITSITGISIVGIAEPIFNGLEKEMENIVIKDSGERTEFSTGAVRDMHVGKGRMDLLPTTAIIELSKHCEAGALKYGERNVDKGIPQHSLIDSGMRHLFKYLRGDKDENHLVAALWNIAWAVEQEVNKPELNDLPGKGIFKIGE